MRGFHTSDDNVNFSSGQQLRDLSVMNRRSLRIVLTYVGNHEKNIA